MRTRCAIAVLATLLGGCGQGSGPAKQAQVQSLISAASRDHAEPLIACGPSSGRAYYVGDGWGKDGIPHGAFLFARDDKGLNLYWTGDEDPVKNSRDDGAEIVVTLDNAPASEFAFVSIYPGDGIAEAYAVTHTDDGGFELSWTSSKARSSAGIVNKAGAYTSVCQRI